jgi:endogenous inhibitor of DNA gyrase (YacG/DUF329 family)
MNLTEVPQRGESVNFVPCPECGKGSTQYDEETGAPRCSVCGAVDDSPDR